MRSGLQLKLYPLIAAALTGVILVLLFYPPSFSHVERSDGGAGASSIRAIGSDKFIYPGEDDMFSEEEMLYFETGIGNATKLNPRLAKFIRKKIGVPRNYKPAHEWARKDYSQFSQSAEIDKLLNNRNNGFFIEVGAHDGLEASNTAFLELQRNWTGLLMEGDPRVYPAMMNCKRRTYMLPHCISPVDKPYRANFRIAGGFQGLSDFFRLHKEPDKNTLKETLVTCFPFNAIMEALGVYHIDFFSLDVEGAELEVLQTIDFKRFKIDLFLIEFAFTPLETKVKESQERLNKYRALFNATGLYKEVGIYNFPGINVGLDVAFKRLDNM